MGIFNKLFSSSASLDANKEEKTLPWLDLTAVSQLNEIVEKSKTKNTSHL